jgi:hypothetical protein
MKIFSGRISRRKMLKIGSLSLSVNAIVVLVLAITMLGLGLAFTKGMFGKLQGKLEIPPPDIPATRDEPIVLPGDTVRLEKVSQDFAMSINIYNSEKSREYVAALDCGSALTGPTTNVLTSPQDIADGDYVPFKLLVKGGAFADSGTAVCVIYVCYATEATPAANTVALCHAAGEAGTDAVYDQKQIVIKYG